MKQSCQHNMVLCVLVEDWIYQWTGHHVDRGMSSPAFLVMLQPNPYTAGHRNFTFDNPCDYFTYGKAKASTLSLSVLVSIEMFNALNALSEVSPPVPSTNLPWCCLLCPGCSEPFSPSLHWSCCRLSMRLVVFLRCYRKNWTCAAQGSCYRTRLAAVPPSLRVADVRPLFFGKPVGATLPSPCALPLIGQVCNTCPICFRTDMLMPV